MHRLAIVDPKSRTMALRDFVSVDEAIKEAGLSAGEVDHGSINRRTGIIVHQYGLFMKPEHQFYFALGGKLYAGNAVLYGIDWNGKTDSVDETLDPTWFYSLREIELAIEKDEVTQPSMSINGQIAWVWPQPVPKAVQEMCGFKPE